MSASTDAARRVNLTRGAEFLRFCAVGGVGFAVDAGVLLAGVHLGGVGPIAGRILSFTLAVWTTFELNRRWAFRGRGDRRRWTAFLRYLGVQGLGFACNFGLYGLLYLTLPAPYGSPLLCLFAGSAAACLVNYTGASVLVFGSR